MATLTRLVKTAPSFFGVVMRALLHEALGFLLGSLVAAAFIVLYLEKDLVPVLPGDFIEDVKLDLGEHYQETAFFSHRLRGALQLEEVEVERAEADGTTWVTDRCFVVAERFSWNDWRPVLVAVPKEVESNRPWQDGGVTPDPLRWFFYRDGTESTIHPVGLEPEMVIESVLRGAYRQ